MGRIASLIETCKLGGVEPYAYLKATLQAIAAGHPASRIDELYALELQGRRTARPMSKIKDLERNFEVIAG